MPGEGVRVGGAWPVTVARRAASPLSFPLEVPTHRPAHSLAMGPTDIMKDEGHSGSYNLLWSELGAWDGDGTHSAQGRAPVRSLWGEDFEIIILSI